MRSNDSISDSDDRFSEDSGSTDANSSIGLNFESPQHSEDEAFHDLLSTLATEEPEEADWAHLFE